MQKLMGLVRRCVEDYHMIDEGDKIAVGVSGGKDSLVLLKLLAGLRSYYNKPFRLDRRPEGDQGPHHDGEPLRLRHGAGREGHAAQEHPGPQLHDSPAPVQGR